MVGTADLSLEKAAVVEELLHRHVRDDRSSLSLDDTFHDILDMVASSGNHSRASCTDLTIRVTCEEHGVLLQGSLVIVRTNSEDSGHCIVC